MMVECQHNFLCTFFQKTYGVPSIPTFTIISLCTGNCLTALSSRNKYRIILSTLLHRGIAHTLSKEL